MITPINSMVGNPSSNDLIHWSDDGDSFIGKQQKKSFGQNLSPFPYAKSVLTSYTNSSFSLYALISDGSGQVRKGSATKVL